MKTNQLSSISNLRSFSMILIVLCHLVAESSISYIQMSA